MERREKVVLFQYRSQLASERAADPAKSEAFRRSWAIVSDNWKEEANRQEIIANFEEGLKTTLVPSKNAGAPK